MTDTSVADHQGQGDSGQPGEPARQGVVTARDINILLAEGDPNIPAGVAGAGLLGELQLTVAPLLEATDATRILFRPGADRSARLALSHVLEADGIPFLRYERRLTKVLVCDVNSTGRRCEGFLGSFVSRSTGRCQARVHADDAHPAMATVAMSRGTAPREKPPREKLGLVEGV